MATQYIEGWAYDGLNSNNRITLTDSGGGPVTFTLGASAVFTDALADWQAQANASGTLNGTYAFFFSLITGKVRLACTETFSFTLEDNLKRWLGFASATGAGTNIYDSDVQPHAFRVMDLSCTDAPAAEEVVELRQYRYGRGAAYATNIGQRVRLEVVDTDTALDILLEGPLLHGKVRVHRDSSNGAVYSPSNLSGYMDVSIQRMDEQRIPLTRGAAIESFYSLGMVGIFG